MYHALALHIVDKGDSDIIKSLPREQLELNAIEQFRDKVKVLERLRETRFSMDLGIAPVRSPMELGKIQNP
nr:hypothetical protein Itr_chr07CG13710 [Ipomoea trifida]GMD19408.1 hypothetical protein Iba_chr07eCG7950 [Ipomoea batatas]